MINSKKTINKKNGHNISGNKKQSYKNKIVLVGLMGAGKTSIGRRLAVRLGLPFSDADDEIEKAADSSIEDIFERLGEENFREGERRVITRLLDGPPIVLATGGGAFMDPETRKVISENGVSIWLRSDLDTLVKRTSKRKNRPLLKNKNHREVLKQLIEVRYPIYQLADIIINSLDVSAEETLHQVVKSLDAHRSEEQK
ncbi:MAG: shikimate kinase [Alphaproteobacteria bacterium]|nr:shikimate kinase [Alphaproteobacteria bacterium]